jgi:hypothetical protein
MKRKILKAVAILVVLFSIFISCDKNKTERNDAVEKAKKLLELETRMNAINTGTGKMSNFMSVIGYSQLKAGELNMDGSTTDPGYSDSIFADTTKFWEPLTCAKVSESDNGDGTHTTIYDYGDGCNEYGSLYKGKIIYIWKNENNTYYSKVIYENYYTYGVEMNGSSEYSFTSDGNSFYSIGTKIESGESGDSTVTIMPVEFNWSGSSSGHEEITMLYDDGTSNYYTSDYSNKWDSTSYKVLEGEYYYKSEADDYVYHYEVTEPLITDYTCTNSWVPVSGTENITNTEKGVTTSYSLNYGTGVCDNLAELIENGVSSIVDFSEIYKIFTDGTVTSTPGSGGKGRK